MGGDSFSVEASVHRVAGTDRAERTFMPMVQVVYPGGMARWSLPGLLFSNQLVRVDLDRVQLVRPGVWSGEVRLATEDAMPLAPARPVLINDYPCDVPLYSTHLATDPDRGVYSLGLRIPRSSWAPLTEAGEGQHA